MTIPGVWISVVAQLKERGCPSPIFPCARVSFVIVTFDFFGYHSGDLIFCMDAIVTHHSLNFVS